MRRSASRYFVDLNAGVRAEVVAGVGGADVCAIAHTISVGIACLADVGVGAGNGGTWFLQSGALTRGEAGNGANYKVVTGVSGGAVVIIDLDVRQVNVAGVGNLVSPGDWRSCQNLLAIEAVGQFVNCQGRIGTEVVAGVGGAEVGAIAQTIGVGIACLADVCVGACDGGTWFLQSGPLTGGEVGNGANYKVVTGVSGGAVVIIDLDVRQVNVAGVGNLVSPSDWRPCQNLLAIEAVGQFVNCQGRIGTEVVAGVGGGEVGTIARTIGVGIACGADVSVGACDGSTVVLQGLVATHGQAGNTANYKVVTGVSRGAVVICDLEVGQAMLPVLVTL